MEIIIAKGAGFCSGVNRALEKTLSAASNDQSENVSVYTLGPIVHNKEVINYLNNQGVKVISDLNELRDVKSANGDINYLVIRSHGVGPDTFTTLNSTEGIEVIDATCPFVRKVQEKASELYNQGYQIYIVGDPNHPEVIGINEWVDNKAIVIETPEQVTDMQIAKKGAIVAQTTLREEIFIEIIEKIHTLNSDIQVNNTICDATQSRQLATKELANKVDIMIVVGGHNSSNTKKLKELAVNQCVPTYHIETAKELSYHWFLDCEKIGVTAGASTPDWTIKEVVAKMKEFENQNNQNSHEEEVTESSQDELMNEESFDLTLKRGQVTKGTVVKITDDEVMVDVGYKVEGSIPLAELPLGEDEQPLDILAEGDEIEIKVVEVDDEEGQLVLSKKWADKDKAWERLEQIYEQGEEVSAIVLEEVKGGLVVDLGQLNGFVPASHVALHYIPDLSVYVGKELRLRPIELDKSKNKVVLSQKIILEAEQEELKQKTLSSLSEGDLVTGSVKRLTNFGAFIDVGGIDGLCHISEISHARIDHPEDVLSSGEEIKVKILSIDSENEKISLSIKEAQPDPFEKFMETYNIGDIVTGKVVRTVNFGAFIEIIPGVEGLCHISQLAESHIAKTEDVVNQGDEVEIKILNIEPENKKVSLSIKEALGKYTDSESSSSTPNDSQQSYSYQDEEQGDVKLGDMFGDVLEGIRKEEEDDRNK